MNFNIPYNILVQALLIGIVSIILLIGIIAILVEFYAKFFARGFIHEIEKQGYELPKRKRED